MIIKFLKKTWIIFLFLVIYIAGIQLNLFPFRFNIFKSNKVEILNTPVLIKEIKKIGQLISAEYYGEVYADLFEAYDDILKDSLNENELKILYEKYIYLKKYKDILDDRTGNDEINEVKEELQNFKLQTDTFTKQTKKYKNEIKILTDELSKTKRIREKKKYQKIKEKLNTARENYNLINKKLTKTTGEINKTQRKLNKTLEDSTYTQRKILKFKKDNNLLYIGRGSVLAGIDLMKLSENNIDTSNRKLLSININEPTIIDTIINPWFIRYKNNPAEDIKNKKKGILGYEIVMNKGSKYTSDDIKAIKNKCVKKLAEAAKKRNILKLAKKSAEETLENFFRLLGFHEVKVKFIKNQKTAN